MNAWASPTPLDSFQAEGAVLMAEGFHGLGGTVLEAEVFIKPRNLCYPSRHLPPSLQPCSDAVVGKFRMVFHHGDD
jgi:hypothetical protein